MVINECIKYLLYWRIFQTLREKWGIIKGMRV
jgi:hypothetical protein